VPLAGGANDEGAVVGAADAEGAMVGLDAAHAPRVTLAVAATSQNAQRGRPRRRSVAVLAAMVSLSLVGAIRLAVPITPLLTLPEAILLTQPGSHSRANTLVVAIAVALAAQHAQIACQQNRLGKRY
jgi:hypothetical protein